MTATLEAPTPQQAGADFAEELRQDVLAISLAKSQFGLSRTFNADEKQRVAKEFTSSKKAVHGGTNLYPVRTAELKAVDAALRAVTDTWLTMTIPYVVTGARLLKKADLPEWKEAFDGCNRRLKAALTEADLKRDEIIEAQRQEIGDELFDLSRYPASFADAVVVEWGVYNFEPSEELLKLAPETYERECRRVRAQFEASIAIYEAEVKQEMAELVETLLGKLEPPKDGEKPKVFKEATINNLNKFFERFEKLGVANDAELAELVDTAKAAVSGTTMGALKKDAPKQGELREQFAGIKQSLDAMMTDKPVRKIHLDDLED